MRRSTEVEDSLIHYRFSFNLPVRLSERMGVGFQLQRYRFVLTTGCGSRRSTSYTVGLKTAGLTHLYLSSIRAFSTLRMPTIAAAES